MADLFREFDIKGLRHLFPALVNDKLADDLFIADVYSDDLDLIKHPCRFDGFLAFYCYSGNFKLEFNLGTYEAHEGSLFIYTPGNIVRLSHSDDAEKYNVHLIIVAISNDMMSSTRFDYNKLTKESIMVLRNPCVSINDKERELCRQYLELATKVSDSGLPNIKDAVTALITSIFYLMSSFWADKLSEPHPDAFSKTSSARATMVLEEFLSLVKEYHSRERCLDFYADKLYLTPKYLSKLIKSVSGQSAHEWISSFVILEAKSLLKQAELSIKDVVYELNFPNQTTFYRFFKAHTGMTPSEYRKS